MFTGAPHWTGAANPLCAMPICGCCRPSGLPSRFMSALPLSSCTCSLELHTAQEQKPPEVQDHSAVVVKRLECRHASHQHCPCRCGCSVLHWRCDVLCRLSCNDQFLVNTCWRDVLDHRCRCNKVSKRRRCCTGDVWCGCHALGHWWLCCTGGRRCWCHVFGHMIVRLHCD